MKLFFHEKLIFGFCILDWSEVAKKHYFIEPLLIYIIITDTKMGTPTTLHIKYNKKRTHSTTLYQNIL